MKRITIFISLLSVVILLLSLNRLTNISQAHLEPFQFLRWQDFNAMIPIPLASIVLYFLLFVQTRNMWINLLFIVGVYLFGASSGTHEVTNYLHHRFCFGIEGSSSLCQIIAYNDDGFSHYVYYLGVIFMNIALLISEYLNPRKEAMSRWHKIIISANAIFLGLGIVANIAFEEIGIDLYAFGVLSAVSLFVLYKSRSRWLHLPVVFYSALAYTLGVVGVGIVRFFSF